MMEILHLFETYHSSFNVTCQISNYWLWRELHQIALRTTLNEHY